LPIVTYVGECSCHSIVNYYYMLVAEAALFRASQALCNYFVFSKCILVFPWEISPYMYKLIYPKSAGW